MAKPLVGSTYPTVTGETKLEALKRIALELPKMQVWSQYWEPGKGYPTFNEAFWNELPSTVQLVLLSVKDSNVPALVANFTNIPEPWRGKVAVTINHEPDQWRSSSNTGGDLSPTVWWQKIQELLNAREGAVWETWVKIYVCFTEYVFRTNRTFWEQNWGSKVRQEPRLDLVMWDVFNIGNTTTRTAEHMFAEIIQFNGESGHDLGLREYGQVTPKDQPTDSPGVVAAISEHWTYLKAKNGTPVRIVCVVWYNNHNNTLSDPDGPRRPQTLQLLQQMVEDANVTESETPDPDHSQYRYGYDAALETLNQQVEVAYALGLAEGRAEVAAQVNDVIQPYVQ